MSESDNDDLARAIELSLQEAARKEKPEVIEIEDDDEENDEEARFQADIQRAIEASKRNTTTPAASQPSTNANPHPATAFLTERAQLERERIERLKRRRPDFQHAASVVVDDSEGEDEDERSRGAKRQHISSSHTAVRRANPNTSSASARGAVHSTARTSGPSEGPSSSSNQSIFWDGELRQTGNKHADPRRDALPVFRISEIISPKEEIEFAIVSAYCWSFPWVYAFFDPKTPVIAVDHSPQGEALIKTILPNWIRTTPFLRGGYGCMHMKLMLLFYRTGRLRIVVSTANLVEYDWRDIENSVWVQDVPRLTSSKPTEKAAVDAKKPEPFESAMVRVLHALNVAPALINFLRTDHPNLPLQRLEDLRTNWDFSRVKAKLIPSISGKHQGWPKVIQSGHTCLMKSLIDLGAEEPPDRELVLECQGSSVGTYSTQWLNEFYCSARGESAQSWLDRPKAARARLPFPTIKILFPSAQYVRDSVLGEAGGGTMFCRRQQWEGKNFPRELFHQTKSKRGRVLMHSKMVLGTFRDKRGVFANTATSESSMDEGAEKLVGWLYVGSHNFTPSAWGTLSGSAFDPTLNITNYELGVLIPLKTQGELDRVVCWERPPRKYVIGQDQPWIQTESPAFAQE